nr:MAG TPA: crystallin beta/gamma motif-containing protein [Caudoviricetes sp.]
MGNVISVIDALAEEKTGGENIEPKVMTADLAQSLYAGELRVPVNANMPRTGAMTNFMYGLVDTTDAFVNDTPEQIKILGGQYDVVMGGLKGDEERIKRGRMNMDTANRNLQFNQQQRDMLTPDAAKDTFGYALGSGVASYGTMVVGGYGGGAAARALGASAKAAGRATGAAAYGTMAAMEVGGEVQERADKYAADTGDNAFKNYEPEKALKNLAAESAYGTISVILEKYLGFGEQRKLFNLDLAKLKSPTLRATASLTKTGVKTAVSEAGTEFVQSLANMGIDLIDGTMDWEQVPDRLKQELTGWAAAAVIGGTAGVGVGIYNRSRGIRAIKEEIRGTVPDADLERTASAIFDSAAEKMADVVSVELELSSQLRNKHGSVMDSMQRAVKQAVDESGAFQDVDEDMLAEYVVDTSKLFADQVLAEANIRNVPIEEVIQASDIVYENGGIRLKSQTEGGESRVLADSSVNVEREQAEKMDVSQEKLYQLPQEAYDAQGKADINTPEFKEWFGDSKVVDKNGRPLVVYHGTNAEFDIFSKEKIKRGTGFWFSSNKETSKEYGDIKEFYLSVKNPIDVNKNRNDFIKFAKEAMPEIPNDVSEHYIISDALGSTAFKEYLQNKGYDAISLGNSYIVFNPNQIKSVYNRGTWNARNDNIYYQRAYAGSRVDYGRPSLEAIGSGEGAQAHGWGLYYALDKDVAEGYRERFINEYGEGIVEYNGVVYKNNDDYAHFLLNLKQTKKGEIARQREIAKFFNENGNIELAKKHKKLAEEGENINVDDIKTLGQVHEVEIPENPFLLDEQLPFSEQPEIVKQGIKNAIKEISEDAEKQIQALENKDFIGREIYNKISLFLAKTPGTLADKETSLLLEKYGIKGITYDGRQDGRAFVIFNPDDVQVIQKFYQLPQDDLNNVIDGHEVIEGFDENAPDDAFVRTKEGRVEHGYITDELAKQIGSSKGGEIRLYNDLDKHIDKGRKKYILSQGYADLIDFVDDTISNWEKIYKGSDESFLITKSKNKDNIVAVKLEQDGKYYKISTALISRKDYLKNKKTLAERAQSNQLLTKSPGAISGTSDIYNIAPTRENVKPDYQNKPQPKGLYDASKRVIKIFESADFSTLPHEIAHYWLDNMWSYVRSGNASEKYRQRWNVIANWLNVKSEQAVLTRGQQEKFARGYEQYLLNGDLPTPIIKGAFDDYDRWLKRVYGDMNRLNVRLSEDAVRFFQSMTTGILPPPRIRPSRKPREKMTTAEKLREQLGLQEQDRQEKETVKLVEEMETARLEPDSIDARTVIVSNITEGETGKSRVYSREVERNIDALQEIADIDLDYNKIRLEEQAQRAADFVKNNLEDARKIIDGRKPAPENILDTAIRIAYEQEMLRIGDNAEYLRALKLHSSLQTLRGQEIVAERISTKDIASPTYWINKLVAHRTYKAASKIFKGYAEAVGGDSPVDLYKKMIKNETDRITKKVLAEKTREEQQKVLNAELKRLRYEYGTGVQGELFQLPLEPLNARNAKMYVREALDDIFGTTVSQEEANQIIGKIGEIEKSIVNTLDETGNPSVQTWQKINEMNNLVESLTPSPALQIATSIVGRGMMLSSIKSPVLNVVSNTENILTEMLIRRAVNSLEGGASFSAVDKNVEKDYLAYADDVYRASGYNVSTTEGLDAATVTLGERRISTQGAGKFRAFARGVETGVFKYLMGYPDSRAKDFVFSDTAALEATTIAQNEGLSGEMLSKRATELYRDATRVAPLTEEGMLIREKAMIEANVATYTNDTAFSKFALGIRETLNKVTGNVRLGDQLMPFVKTPANVVALGMEYSIGAAYLIPNLTTVIRDVKAGKLSAKSRTAIKAAVRNGLGVVLAMLIAMALDPDDYTPDYDALTMSERRLALEKNAVFNSIRIGDKYISLDYFGPLAVPLTAVLSARRRGEVAWFGYAKGVASQLQKLPGLQEFSETVDAIGRATSNKPEKTVKNLNNALIDFVRARTIPSIVNDLAKSIDTYERETSAGTYDKAQASVPGIREELPLKYTTTSRTPKETEAALSILLFGARVKTAASNRVIYEIDRLYKKNAKPTITDVTRSGKLSELSEAKQQRVRKEFAKRYYDGVYTLIRTREYRAKDDEQRAAAINKVRRQIIEQLKKEYIK